ncbi:hypothetical protein KIN20_031776 [Parelaphostrongylus tenuis]|uniref:Uncharacterized protein n=1 Tax=Parelaphostrongylus tenuis TaxID=148309 RepID=A0AAD5R5L9_PARTN|nr:hypothetical protein KIN20_031776 [Parelaphostrongylus tenuis]
MKAKNNHHDANCVLTRCGMTLVEKSCQLTESIGRMNECVEVQTHAEHTRDCQMSSIPHTTEVWEDEAAQEGSASDSTPPGHRPGEQAPEVVDGEFS